MNEWVRRSIKTANSRGYLDRLHDIYPVGDNRERNIPPEALKGIRAAFKANDRKGLLELLLALDRFPFKDPYVALLRQNRKFLRSNPRTVRRITDKVFAMGVDKLVEGACTPKEANTQIGPQFRSWLKTLGFPFETPDEFERRSKGISFLTGSDADLAKYANAKLNCGLDKEPDFIARSGRDRIVGEAKFLSASGGHQNTSLQDALRMVKGVQGRAHRVAVLDGIIWFPSSGKMFQAVEVSGSPILTALLLPSFLKKF